MRVTDRMIFDNASRWTGDAQSRMEAASEVASTGQRVVHPGDDPAAAGVIALHHQASARADAIASATGLASDELGAADGALSAAGNAVERARQLAVQLSNSSYNANDRAAAAVEVQSLLQQTIAALNTRSGGRYLFGGSKDDAPPFDASGNYSGDAVVRQVEVAPGVVQDASVRADVAFKGAGGGADVLATLQQLATALAANNLGGVQASLDGLDKGTAQIAVARGAAGSSMAAFDAANAVATAASATEKTAASHLEDADVVDSATRLQLAQRALEASISAATQSFQLSLLGQK